MRRFVPGTAVALRDVVGGRLLSARPATVVRDHDQGWMFFLPIGNRWYGPDAPRPWVALKSHGADWRLTEHRWTAAHVLSFAWPGAGHAVLHFWDEEWTPVCWYVNVEAPLERAAVGFDTLDHDLDVVVEPDRSSWRWKDEEDVAEGVRLGAYTPEQALEFRHEAERGLRRVLDREPPFDRDWSGWRPDPLWPEPVLPDGWDRL
ncbi:MAG TPA: DUF402 domain-containing protein [Actinomycetota bacterium]